MSLPSEPMLPNMPSLTTYLDEANQKVGDASADQSANQNLETTVENQTIKAAKETNTETSINVSIDESPDGSVKTTMDVESTTNTASVASSASNSSSSNSSNNSNNSIDSEGNSIFHLRSLPILILATVAFIFSLQMAKAFFIPVIFSILLAYTLNPIVATLERYKISRLLSTTIVLLTLLFGTAFVTNSLINEFNSILIKLPDAARQLGKEISRTKDDLPSTMEKIQAVATEIEAATTQNIESEFESDPNNVNGISKDGSTGNIGNMGNIVSNSKDIQIVKPQITQKNNTTRNNNAKQKNTNPAIVVVDQRKTSKFQVRDWVWATSFGAAGFVGQLTMIFFLLFFILASGDRYKRKLVKITGPSISSKKITVIILDAINKSIQNYMFMLLVTTLILITLMWISLRLLGVENAGAWAVAAGCLHIIPYVGTLVFTIALGASVLVQFGSFSQTALVVGVNLAVTIFVGTLITTWMTGRIAKMNPLAIFIGLLFWGWLWGIWGLLLGIPIVMMIRVVADHVDGMQSVAELLSE